MNAFHDNFCNIYLLSNLINQRLPILLYSLLLQSYGTLQTLELYYVCACWNVLCVRTVTCMVVHVTKMTGSNSDDWIILALWVTTTLNYTYIHAALLLDHTLQSTIAHALGFSVY
jgi:hypothetical protein